MSIKRKIASDNDALDQLVGIVGVGWTVSLLGYLGTVIGYGNWLVAHLFTDPQSLLYIGSVLFVATFGLDRLQDTTKNGDK